MATLFVALLGCFLMSYGNAANNRSPKIYDILSLIYQLCSADATRREQSLNCTEHFMHASVSKMFDQCLVGKDVPQKGKYLTEAVDLVERMCMELTLVRQWTSKHNKPPRKLTKVISIGALGRMACVLYGLQLPLDMWSRAFTECFVMKWKDLRLWPKPETNNIIQYSRYPGSNSSLTRFSEKIASNDVF